MRKLGYQESIMESSERLGAADKSLICSGTCKRWPLRNTVTYTLLFFALSLISVHADAQCPVSDHNTSDQTIANHAAVGSSFQAACDGLLSAISVTFTGNSGDDGIIANATLTVYSGDPDVGTVEGQLTGLNITNTGEQSFDLTSLGIVLTNGNNYSFLLDDDGDADQFNYNYETTDNFAGGSLWFDPDGSTLTNAATSDLEFSFSVTTPQYSTVWLDDNGDGDIDQLRLDFSENVDFTDGTGPGDIFDAFTVAGITLTNTSNFNSVNNAGSFTFDVTGITGTEAPSVDVIYNTGGDHTIISAASGVEILDGSTATSNSDVVAPVLQNAVAVNNTLIRLQYSEPVTVTFNTASDWTATGITATGAVVNGSDNTIVDLSVDPINDPGYSATDLTLNIDDDAFDQVIDVFGNAAANINSGVVADGQSPGLVGDGTASFEPDDQSDFTGTVNSATTGFLDIIFDENVKSGSGNISLLLDTDEDGVADATIFDISSGDPAVTFIPEADATDKLRIDLSSLGVSLTGLVSYFVNVDNGAVTDIEGNDYAGFSDAATWNFTTTADAVAPVVSSLTPSDNAANVAIDADFTINFNEPVSAGTTEEIRLYLSSGDVLIETVLASSLTINDNAATIDFVTDLSGFADYYITVEPGIVTDRSGNAFAGFSSKNTWNFKTESGTDVTAPEVIEISPVDGATDISTLPSFSISFNEPVTEGTGNFYIRNGAIVESFDITSDATVAGNTVTFTSSVELSGNTGYTVDWDAGVVTDSDGNPLAVIGSQAVPADGSWNFTTIADVAPPAVISYSPANDQTGVSPDVNLNLVINFDEPVDIGTGDLEIYYNDGTTLVPSQTFDVSSFALSNSDQTATLTVGPLDGNTEYYVAYPATAFADRAVPSNNVVAVNPDGSWSFVTANDASAPTITSLSPANLATGVDLQTVLTIDFSERIFAGSGNITLSSASQTININVADGTQISGFGTNSLTIDPSSELFGGETYTVSVSAGAIRDASGNAFDNASLTWSFTTEAGVTVTAATESVCEDGDFVSLSNIIIAESANDNFAIGNTQTIVLNLPEDFEFNTAQGSISAPSGDITATNLSVASGSLTITYSIGSVANADALTISGLQVRYNGSAVLSGIEVYRDGSADQEGNQPFQEQPHIILNTFAAPAAPAIEQTSAPGIIIDDLGVVSVSGSTFSLQVNSSVGGSVYRWENVEGGGTLVGTTATETNLNASAGFDVTNNRLWSFDVTETNVNGCESPATRFNILTYDLTLTPSNTTFSVDDNTGTDITISKPANHTASFSGTALGNISIPAAGTAGDASATFVPSTAGSDGSPYQITYRITNIGTMESFELTEGLNFTVNPLVTIFTNAVPVEYCFTNDDVNNDVDLDVSITPTTPTNFFFYRIALFDEDDVEVPAAITEPAGWTNSGLGAGVPGLRTVSGHYENENWTIDPGQVAKPGTYALRYFIIRNGTPEAQVSNREVIFRTQDIEIFELPDVRFTSFTNTEDLYCEDDGLVTIEATLNGGAVTVDGYRIAGTSGTANGLSANITGDAFDPSDPLNNGLSYAGSQFTIRYTSDPADDVNGCVSSVEQNVKNLEKPSAPTLIGGTDTGSEILYEFCEGIEIPDFNIAAPAASPTEYIWQDANGTIPTFEELASGSSASAFELFGTLTPDPDTYRFAVKRVDTENSVECESDVQTIEVIVYDQPFLPELDLTSSASGSEVSLGVVEYNYCVGDTYEDFTLFNDLTIGSRDSSYIWLDEDKDVIPRTSIADPINLIVTPEELGLDLVDLSSTFDTTFYVIAGEYRNTPQFSGCTSDTLTINITIHANPAAPAIGDTGLDFYTDYYACMGDSEVTGDGSENLSVLLTPKESGSTYRWYEDSDGTGVSSGAFILEDDEIDLSDLSGGGLGSPLDLNTAGVYYFWLTKTTDEDPSESFDGCESPATRINITVYPDANAPVPASQGVDGTDYVYNFCEGDITTGTTFTVDRTFNPFMGAAGLSRQFKWYQANSAGAITNPTSINVADADGSVATAVELGLVGATAQTRYFLVTHVENIRDDGNFGGCESSGALIRVDVIANPAKPTVVGGNTIEYCNGSTVADISVTGEGNAGEIFIWYRDGMEIYRGSTATATDLGINTNLSLSLVDDSLFVYTVTQTQDIDFGGITFSGCEGPEETVTVIVHPVPVTPVVAVAGNLSICSGGTLPTLSVSNQQPGATLSWRNSSGTEVSTATNFDPSISNATPGSTTFSVIQLVDNCPSASTDFTITVNPIPAIPVITGNTSPNVYEYCAASDVSSATLQVSSANATSTYTWYQGITTANPLVKGSSVNFTDLDLPSASLDINTPGSTSFFVRETSAAGCEGEAREVVVTINPLPNLSLDNLQAEYCFDDPAFIITGLNNGAVPATPANGSFTISTGGLTDNGDGTATINPSAAATAAGQTREGDISVHTVTYTFIDNNSCVNTIMVDFSINPQPVLDIETPFLVSCFSDASFTLQGRINGLDATAGSFTINTGGLTDNGDGTATFDPSVAALASGETETGNASFHIVTFTTTDSEGCSNSTTLNLTVNPLPDLNMVLEDNPSTDIDGLVICFDDPNFIIQGIADGVDAIRGSFDADIGGLTDNNDGTARFNPGLAAIAAGETREGEETVHTITFTYTDANGCENTNQAVITVKPQPTLDIVYQSDKSSIKNDKICFDASPFQIRGQVENAGVFSDIIASDISINTAGLTFNPATGIATLNPAVAGAAAGETETGDPSQHEISLTYADAFGCENIVRYTITISPSPEVSIRNADGTALKTNFCVEDEDHIFQAFADNNSVTANAVFTIDGVTQAVNNGQIAFSPSGRGANTYTLEMTYTDPDDPSCDNVVTETIVVNPLPAVELKLETDQTTDVDGISYCFDQADVVFRGMADGVPATSGTFTASNGGLMDNGNGTATFSPDEAAEGASGTREGDVTSHVITFSYTNEMTGCEESISSTVTVFPLPALDLIYLSDNSSINNSNLCFDAGLTQIRGIAEITSGFEEVVATDIRINTAGLTYDAATGIATLDPQVAAEFSGGTETGSETTHLITMEFTDTNGCSNSITYQVTVSPRPDVSIRSEDGSTLVTEYCEDITEVTFQAVADNSFATSGVTYTFNNATTTSPADGRYNFRPADLGPGTYTLQMTYTDGSGPQCANSVTETIIVNPLPALDIVLNSDQSTSIDGANYCFDDNAVTFRGLTDGSPATAGSFTAQFGGLTDNGDGTATFNPQLAAAGADETREGETSSHDITYTFTNTSTSCEQTIIYTVTVSPQPTLDIVFQSNSNSISNERFCYDAGEIQIRGRVEVSGSFVNRVADSITVDSDGITYDATTGIATFDPVVAAAFKGEGPTGDETTHNISMYYTDPLGCQNSITYQVVVVPLPELDIRNADGSVLKQEFCLDDDPLNFQAVADNINVTSDVSFTLENLPVTVTAGQITFSPSAVGVGEHTLVMTYTDPADPNCRNSITREINVYALPDLSITRLSDGVELGSANFDEFCFDEESVVLSGTNGGVPVDGEWRVEFRREDGTFETLLSSVIAEQPDGSVIFRPNSAAIASGMTRTGDETDMRVYFSFQDENSCIEEVFADISINPQPQLELVDSVTNSPVGNSSVCFDEDPFTIVGRFDGVNNAESGVFTIDSDNSSMGFVDNGNGTATFNPSVIAGDNGQARTDDDVVYTITFNYTDDNGCSNSIDREITINGQPEISFTGEFTVNNVESSFTTTAVANSPIEICVVQADHFALGSNPVSIELRGNNNTGTFSGPGITNEGNGSARFSPLTARGNDLYGEATKYVITYTINETDVNGTLCINSITQEIIVNPVPEAIVDPVDSPEVISVSKACFGVDATVSIDISNVADENLTYEWSVEGVEITSDNTSSSFTDDLSLERDRERTYTVLVTNTLTGCSIEYSRTVGFGAVPDPKFKWDFVTAGRPTIFSFKDQELESPANAGQFQGLEFYIVDSNNDTIFESRDDLDIGLGDSLIYTFANAGRYTVSMVVNTINGCSTTISRPVDIVPLIPVANEGYSEDFEEDSHGWYTNSVLTTDRFEAGITPSWEVGIPTDTYINTAGSGARAWVTDLDDDYQNNERTYVYSPTFDVSQMENPTISFQRITRFDSNGDGAVLQISLNDGLTWSNLGDVSDEDNDNILEQSGILWYNSLFIRGFQGDETNPNSVGWTNGGTIDPDTPDDEKWVTSIHKLNLEPEDSDSLRFRFAIGSNADGVSEGFGFDNFTIFNRSRRSVLETFSTVLSDLSLAANSETIEILSTDSLFLADVIHLNYFNDFQNDPAEGRIDPLNDRNQIVPGTISTFYGINEVPRAVINGAVQQEVPSDIEITGELTPLESFRLRGWSNNELSNSALSEPLVEIRIEELPGDDDEINLTVTVESIDNFADNIELTTRIFIVEGQVNPEDLNAETGININEPVYNVVRTMLPDPDGFNYIGNLTDDQIIGEYTVSWQVSGVYHPDDLKAIVYVQNENSGLIYQGAEINLSAKENVVTGVEKQILSGADFALYPNPANDLVNVSFDKPVGEETSYRLIDQTGKILIMGQISAGTEEFSIPTEELAGGVYFITVGDNGRTLKPRRLIVIPR